MLWNEIENNGLKKHLRNQAVPAKKEGMGNFGMKTKDVDLKKNVLIRNEKASADQPCGISPSLVKPISGLKDECLNWVKSVRDNPETNSGHYKYNRHMLRPCGLESTAHAVFILWILDALDKHEDRDNMVRFLKSTQDPLTGYFKDPLLNDGELAYTDGAHSWQHIWDHHTYVVHNALLLCGELPDHPLPNYSHTDFDKVDPEAWTRALDWSQPYLVAEEWMTTVKAYLTKHAGEPHVTESPQIQSAFKAMESVIEPESGMPIRLVKENPEGQGLGGIFKLLFAYVFCGRDYPYADNAVRSILKTQSDKGDFAGANMCMNWDAIVALRFLSDDLRRTAHRKKILQACQKLAERLCRDFRKSDGGFSFFHNTCLPNHNSVRVSAYYPESDVLGTAMCLDSLAIMQRWCCGKPGRSFLDVWTCYGKKPDELMETCFQVSSATRC
ncbi:MAG: hypothetical protein JW808_05170 [Victivallales bacterium]|nr:hypothetical protein [Victivallales bacterium]